MYSSKEQDDKGDEAKVNFTIMPRPEDVARQEDTVIISCANMSLPSPKQPELPPRLPPRHTSAAVPPANQTTTQLAGSMHDTKSVTTDDEKWKNHGEERLKGGRVG